jgi:adenosine deaminase
LERSRAQGRSGAAGGGARPLAELHLHLYGTIRWDDFLSYIAPAERDYAFYEQGFERVYGQAPPLRHVLERHRAGDPGAAHEFRRLFVFGDEDAGDFARFQAKFNLLIAGSEFLRMHLYDDPIPPLLREVKDFAAAVLDAQRAEGIGYAEQRFMLDFDNERCRALYAPLLAEYRRRTTADIVPRLAVSLPREDPWPQWELVKDLALGPDGESLTGVDFCFVEEGHPPKEKAEFFRAVHEWNDRHPERALAILYHVGESFTDKSLESAVRWVQESAENGAHRLGHAIALGVDPDCYGAHERGESVAERRDQIAYDLAHAEGLRKHGVRVEPAALERERAALAAAPSEQRVTHRYDAARLDEVRRRQDYAMQRVRRSGAVIEVCPTSNRRIGAIADPQHHPVHRFFEHGLPVVVSSDDPGIFDTTLADEIAWVVEHAALPPDAVDELTDRAWRSRSEVLTGRER